MRWPKLKTIALIGGAALAFSPLLAAHLAISWHVRSLAESAVADVATQMVERADAAINEGLDALTDLARARVSTCGPDALEAMRRAVYANYSIKEIGVTDDSGRIVCNHIGDHVAVAALSNGFAARNGNVTIQAVSLGRSDQRGLMMSWSFGGDTGLSVITASEVVVSDILPSQMRGTGLGMMTLADGTLVGTVPRLGSSPADRRFDEATVSARVKSLHYPIEVSVFVPLATFWTDMASFMKLVDFGGMLIAGVILGLLLYALNRPRGEATDIREAMERGEFIPFYQPVVDIQNGRLMGCEVLMRRRLPDGTILPPGLFIALAEATGLALPMTRKLMEAVRDDLDSVYGARPHLKLSVNLFDDHFESLRIIRDVQTIFGPSKIDFGQVTLEITERQPLANIDRARVVVRRLQELGVRVALDDAGTGHGGLAYLQQLGIDVIKIDKLFVDTIDKSDHAAPILDSLITLGHEMGMDLIAEGVEEMVQVEYLRARGVSAAQGYLFAPPLPSRSFVDLVEAMDPIKAAPAEAVEPPAAKVA